MQLQKAPRRRAELRSSSAHICEERPGITFARNRGRLTVGVRGAGNKIGGDQMGDIRCAFPLKAIDGYL